MRAAANSATAALLFEAIRTSIGGMIVYAMNHLVPRP